MEHSQIERHIPDRVEYEANRIAELSRARSLKETERREILSMIDLCQGSRREAAQRLGISEATIYRRLREYRNA